MQLLTRFLSTTATFLASRQLTLGRAQPAVGGAGMPWIGDLRAITEHDETGESDVDADRQIAGWQWFRLRQLQAEADVPVRGLPSHGHRLDAAREWPMPDHFHLADALQVQPSRGSQRAAITPRRIRQRVVAIPRTKARVAHFRLARLYTSEERLERLVDPPQDVLARREVGDAHVTRRADPLSWLAWSR